MPSTLCHCTAFTLPSAKHQHVLTIGFDAQESHNESWCAAIIRDYSAARTAVIANPGSFNIRFREGKPSKVTFSRLGV